MPVRVGIDLVAVEQVSEAVRTHGERYLARVYSPRELADCAGADGPDPVRLAARFAAKEAAIKALRPAGTAVPWTSIEVRRDPGGWTELELSGAAAELAGAAGIASLAVSLTHEGSYASAVVVAEIPTRSR